ncbi:MAG: hypothetical protein M3464_01935 [Chloroflexota bacterium]|nr:hypothetical protein [Chloroflexota bacterium]
MSNQHDSPASNPPSPRPVMPRERSRPRSIPFNVEAIDLIAETLGVPAGLASFRLPNAAVHQLVVPGAEARPAAMLTLWPSIRRVDAIGPALTVVFTDVRAVELIDQVEVIFRRGTSEMLIVATGGKIIVRA